MTECACGCGGTPRKASSRYVRGHQHKLTSAEYVIDPISECWNWQRYKAKSGYGWMTVNGKNTLAHRHYYARFKGEIPDGMQLDHLCRNRGCVNPAHLEPVTHAENGRRGANTKLTAADASAIRELAATKTHRELAAMFGISHQTVGHILTNRIWVFDGHSRRTRRAA